MHPYLYKAYCRRKLDDEAYEKCIEAAGQAMSVIDENKTIRADIAELGAEAARETEDAQAERAFYIHAFHAAPDRMRLLKENRRRAAHHR